MSQISLDYSDNPQSIGLSRDLAQLYQVHSHWLDEQSFQSLILLSLPGLGNGCYWQLQESGLAGLPSKYSNQIQSVTESSVVYQTLNQTLSACCTLDVTIVHHEHQDYPQWLRETVRPPALLYVLGELTNLQLPQIAVVGSRKATRNGLADAFSFSRDLTHAGFVITSGLALGIDTQAHLGALEAQGRTIAVLGSGFSCLYPKQNKALAQRILSQGGTLVSEFAPDIAPQAHNFPKRNRIISGLSLGTLVVEASEKSGSLITARLACEQNREVFALPGSIHNVCARGCHRLIREGATLVECSQDIVSQLGASLSYLKTTRQDQLPNQASELADMSHLNSTSVQLWDCLRFDPMDFDQLVNLSQLTSAEVADALVELELEGLVESSSAGFSKLARRVS